MKKLFLCPKTWQFEHPLNPKYVHPLPCLYLLLKVSSRYSLSISTMLFVCSFYFGNETDAKYQDLLEKSRNEKRTYLGKLLRKKGVSNTILTYFFLLKIKTDFYNKNSY